MTPRQAIEQIDRQIDANTRALMGRLHFNPGMSAQQWHGAYDRCPDLRARRDTLYRQRGIQQHLRDAEDHRAWQAEQRKERARQAAATRKANKARRNRKPCPACGQLTAAA